VNRAQSRRWQSDTPEEERLRKWFLEPTIASLKKKGWRVNFDQKGREIYAKQSPWPRMKRIYLNTWSSPGEFQLRLDFSESQEMEPLLKKASESPSLPQEHLTVDIMQAGKSEPGRKALDFFIAKENLFYGVSDDESKKKVMLDRVVKIHELYE
jgi:hypothetical protein